MGDSIQVNTPSARVIPVKATALPVLRRVSK